MILAVDKLSINLQAYSGANWLKSYVPQMSEFGAKVADILGWVFQGIYHIDDEVLRDRSVFEHRKKVSVTIYQEFATYDSPRLTMLFLACCQQRCTVEIGGSRPGYTRLTFFDIDSNHEFFVKWNDLFQEQEQGSRPFVFQVRTELGMIDPSRQRWAYHYPGKPSIADLTNVGLSHPGVLRFGQVAQIIKLSHQYAVRIAVRGLSYRSVEIMFHQRDAGGKTVWERHPSFEESVKGFSGGSLS